MTTVSIKPLNVYNHLDDAKLPDVVIALCHRRFGHAKRVIVNSGINGGERRLGWVIRFPGRLSTVQRATLKVLGAVYAGREWQLNDPLPVKVKP